MHTRLCARFLTLVAVAWPAAVAVAQYPSAVVGFNGPPIDDPATCQEMFRIPQWSGTTNIYVIPNTGSAYDYNGAYRASGLQTEGAAAMQVYFNWVNPADPDAWVRLTTFSGPVLPNPALHTLGKVRFKLTNRSELFAGTIGLCLGIRETGELVGQLEDGGATGPIEWVGVNTTPNGITAGDDLIVDTAANLASDDVQVVPVGANLGDLGLPSGTAVVDPGANGLLETVPAGDDQIRSGYSIGANGNRVPIPAITLAPSVFPYTVEFNLATGAVTVNGVPYATGFAGFTGDGVLNAPSNRGTLEHIAFTNVTSDTAVLIDVALDELQFEATEPDPVRPPRVVWPIIAGDTQVTVTDLMASVDQVRLFVNGNLLATQPVTTPDDVVFSIAGAVTGDAYTATQRNGQNGQESPPSEPVVVLPEPPVLTLTLLVDEGGTGSCNYNAGWEWVGATSVQTVGQAWWPVGLPLFANDAVWQVVDVPLDDDDLILGGLGGDGALGPSPTGFYTIDSVWFTQAGGAADGPWEVFIDRVELIDEFGQPGAVILGMEDLTNHFPVKRGQSQDVPTATALSGAASFDGLASHRFGWTYDGVDPESLGILQRVGADCGTSELIEDTTTAIRLHLVCRGQPTNPAVPLPVVGGPIVAGSQNTVRVTHEAGATLVSLYVNGTLATSQANAGNTFTDFGGLALLPGDSVSARQTVPANGQSDFAYPRGVMDAPYPPIVGTPVFPGAPTVTVAQVYAAPYATASAVNVYVNGVLAGSAVGGSATVDVPVTVTLMPGDLVTATQTVNGVVSAQSDAATVAATTAVYEYEFALTLASLSRSISNSDFIHGRQGALENGDVDPANGIEAWNMVSTSGCMEMAYTQPSPGFHPATPGGWQGGIADLTDGIAGSTVEAVLADYYRAALVVRYDFDPPANIEQVVVFAANEDPNAPNNGRLYQHYDVWMSSDGGQSFSPLAMGVKSGSFGILNTDDNRATFTRVWDGLRDVLAADVTNLRFVFYDVSNTAGRFQDPWQGNANEDAAYQTACPTVEPEDTDGFRKAFEAPIIKEVDVFGYYAGDYDGDGDLDAADWAALESCYTGPDGGPLGSGCGTFDFAVADDDVDLADFAKFQERFTGP